MKHLHTRLTPVLAGALAVLGYAPFYLFPIPILTLAWLFHRLQHAASPAQAFRLGALYGLGLYGTGVSWIYVSLHDFGDMPMPLAALATALLCAFIAMFPGITSYVSAHYQSRRIIALPAAWVLMEWVLNWIFTGFPWMTLGNTQVPFSPLAGLAPLCGIFGVSLAAAACAALITGLWQRKRVLLAALAGVWIVTSALGLIAWTTPSGAPTGVSLLQGNIPQDLKWREDEAQHTLQTYFDLARQHPAPLMVLPETALPMLLTQVPADFRQAITQAGGGEVIAGVIESENGQYYNSMANLRDPAQIYRKQHLVPFGEFIPLKSVLGWIYRDFLHIPLTDLSSGAAGQRPMLLAGQRVALDICYEDVFGEEIIRQLPEATLLVNASNDAWYGRSLAAHQHLQMSQTRALETGRMVLRATNTGATAIIDAHGRIVAEAPQFTTTALTGEVQGYTGTTPYVRWGNIPVIALILLALGLLWGRKKK